MVLLSFLIIFFVCFIFVFVFGSQTFIGMQSKIRVGRETGNTFFYDYVQNLKILVI